MEVLLTDENVEGEPGPNMYWRGSPDKFLKLLGDIHLLAVANGSRIALHELDYVTIEGARTCELISSEKGNVLVGVEDDRMIMNLDCQLWREVLHFVLSVSFVESHNYVELSEPLLREDANIVLSSEHD